MSDGVLVVAGEVSGDRIAAGIVRALGRRGIPTFGMGGRASACAGAELVADITRTTAMGTTELVGRVPAIARAYLRLLGSLRARRPEAAVLVDYTEFNARLGRRLRASNIPVLWCVAPQIWAWRPERARRLLRAFDRLALVLPFEEVLWRGYGADARYVGHPALDACSLTRDQGRARVGLSSTSLGIALLPGSRPHEIRTHLPVLLAAFEHIRATRPHAEARILVASPQLEHRVRTPMPKGVRAIAIDAVEGAAPLLPAFDAAIVVSGTATLECALAAVPSVIVYRASALTAALARKLLRTRSIGLPNILLDEPFYPELLQQRCEPAAIASALLGALDDTDRARVGAKRLRALLGVGPPDEGRAPHAAGSTEVGALPGPSSTGTRELRNASGTSTVAERMTTMLRPWIDV